MADHDLGCNWCRTIVPSTSATLCHTIRVIMNVMLFFPSSTIMRFLEFKGYIGFRGIGIATVKGYEMGAIGMYVIDLDR